jgi:hypothetical protein
MDIIRSELDELDYKTTYLKVKPIEAVRGFLLNQSET